MGNNQSNENTRKSNYKIYKITSVNRHSGWARCHLDGYVPYNDGNYKHIDFKEDSTGFSLLSLGAGFFGHDDSRAVLSQGWLIEIDIDLTRNLPSGRNFDKGFARAVGLASGSFSGEGGLQGVVGDIAEAREIYISANEWSSFDKQMQRGWQLQPPKK